MTTCLVTGGAGFIGSHLVDAVVSQGHAVRVLDNFSTGRRENLSSVLDRIDLHEGDIVEPDDVWRAVDGCEVVYHLAAVASVQASVDDPLRTHRVNVDGTLNVMEAARRADVDRFVFASSAAVYGDHAALPLGEDLAPRTLSPYAAHKVTGEMYCRAYHASFGLPTVALRFFNIYGPRQDPSSPYSGVISIFARRMTRGERPTIYGDGRQTRDFVYVADVVRALLAAVECEEAVGRVFNVARGRQTSILRLVEGLNTVLGSSLEPEFGPPRSGEVRFSEGDGARARELLGWSPRVSLKEGLMRLIEGDYGRIGGEDGLAVD